jgi:UDP-4-amino-4,6-dideoxy-N-acetyl-beta-L-altrosamine transaminase
MIPYGRHNITKDDIESVIKVLKSEFLTTGPVVPKFEHEINKVTKSHYSIAVNSCTSGLHIACLALGLKDGDILWTSPISFVASANCGLYCRATIDFVDIDEDTALISISKLKQKLEEAKKNGVLPKILIPVHFAGQPCDMEEIYNLSKIYGFRIIEDAAHALGGAYKGSPIGSCKYSDITVFSFHPVKIITTGEGGIATTNDLNLSKKMQLYRSHGLVRNPNEMSKSSDGPWYYEIPEIGFNYRMTDIAAALGISQLKRLREFTNKRRQIAAIYDREFTNTPINFLKQKNDRNSSYHLYVIKIEGGKRDEVFNFLKNAGIGVQVHYIPIYKFSSFNSQNTYSSAEGYYKKCITIPLYPGLSKVEIDHIVNTVKSINL